MIYESGDTDGVVNSSPTKNEAKRPRNSPCGYFPWFLNIYLEQTYLATGRNPH